MSADERPVVAAFDFDGTLTSRDSLLPFLRFVHGDAGFAVRLLRTAPWFAAYGLRLVSNETAKQQLLRAHLGGMAREQLDELGAAFAAQVLPRLVRPAALARLRWHQERGHCTMVVSASLDIYLEPWGRALGVGAVIASRLQYDGAGRASGMLLGGNCWGPEKRARLLRQLPDRDRWRLYAYGDSRGDREMLDLADRGYYRYMPSTGAEQE